ncbi:MAG: TetR/AcrR family transcriptional regulator [Caulobacteraceae bacterium]
MAKQKGAAQQKPKRNPGRPFSTDANDAREAILQAACRLLKDNLPSQVTNSMIAREAGADPALIRYYFGDRSSLLLAAVEELMKNIRLPTPPTPMNIQAFVTWRVDATLHFARMARSMQRLMVDELAEGGTAEVREAVRLRNKGLVDRYGEILRDEIGDEIVEVDPLFLHVAILGVCEFFTAAQSVILPLAEPGTDPVELAGRYEAFVIDLFLNGLRRR